MSGEFKSAFSHNIYKASLFIVFLFVSLTVGLNMVRGNLFIPFLPSIISGVAGWLTIIAAVLVIVLSIKRR